MPQLYKVESRVIHRLLTVCSALFITGCSLLGTYNSATSRYEFIVIPTSNEVAMGDEAHESILRRYELSDDAQAQARLERIGQDLVGISDRQDYSYQFFLIDKDDMNAFTSPGGRIYFFTGLLDKMTRDDQVAAVLAHEIGHCAARHVVKKFQAALGYNLLGSILLSQIDSVGAQRVAGLSSDAVMSIVFSSYSRKDEFEADRLAVKYMYLAGYDLQAIIETFEILKSAEEKGSVPGFLRSHPYLGDRMEGVKKEVEAVKSRFGPEDGAPVLE